MKKLVLFGSICLMAILLAACSKETQEAVESVANDVAEVASAAEAIIEEASNSVAVMPESYGSAKLGEYEGLTYTALDIAVTDADVESTIDSVVKNDKRYEEVDRAAQLGDTVNIDFEGKLDGVAFDGGTAQGYDLVLGSGSFIDGFEDGLVGAKKGETKDLNLTFPENYGSEELAGKATVFTVTVNAVKEPKESTFSDEWVKEFTGDPAATMETYKEEIRKELKEQRESSAKAQAQQEILKQLVDRSSFEMNEEAIAYEKQAFWDQYESYAAMYGMSVDDLLKQAGQSREEIEEQIQGLTEDVVKQRIALDEIFKAENMSITEDDEIKFADRYGYTVDVMKGFYGEDMFEESIKQEKVLDFLYEKATAK